MIHAWGRTLLLLIALCTAPGLARAMVETEPNDETWQANPIACGDSVQCAMIERGPLTDNFRFTVLGPDSVFLTSYSCLNSVNTFLILYDSNDSILATDNWSGPGECGAIRYRTSGPGDFVIRVMRAEPSIDSVYTLTVECLNPPPEAYDQCASPRVIENLPYYDEGSTYGATNQAGTAAPDVFYKFHNYVVANYSLTVCSSTWDARVAMLTWCHGGWGDDESVGCGLGAALTTYGLPVGDYLIMVEGMAANQQGDFSLEIDASLPPCPEPSAVVMWQVGGFPFLEWPDLTGPQSYTIWHASAPDGTWEHIGQSPFSYYVDSLGFNPNRRFYRVSSTCPW